MPDEAQPEAEGTTEEPKADELPEHSEGEVEPEGTANADEGA